MSHPLSRALAPVLGLLLSTLVACRGTGSSATSSSTLNLRIPDSPLDGATKVWIQFTGVERTRPKICGYACHDPFGTLA